MYSLTHNRGRIAVTSSDNGTHGGTGAVQTGPNNQLGGLDDGLFNGSYHSDTASAVIRPAIAPYLKGKVSGANSLKIFYFLI